MIMTLETEMRKLNTYLIEYLNMCFNDIYYNQDNLDEYLEDEFKFKTTNDWDNTGNDFSNYIEEKGIELTINTQYYLIRFIIDYYKINFGDSNVFIENITYKNVLRHYAYIEVNELSIEDLKKYLNI